MYIVRSNLGPLTSRLGNRRYRRGGEDNIFIVILRDITEGRPKGVIVLWPRPKPRADMWVEKKYVYFHSVRTPPSVIHGAKHEILRFSGGSPIMLCRPCCERPLPLNRIGRFQVSRLLYCVYRCRRFPKAQTKNRYPTCVYAPPWEPCIR